MSTSWPTLTRDELGPKQQTRYDELVNKGVWDTFVLLASQVLERLTAHRVTQTPVTVRPVRPGRSCGVLGGYGPYAGPGMQPINWAGAWFNVYADGRCLTECEVRLPPPVTLVSQVVADGVVLDPEQYEIQSEHILVWTGDGPCPWTLDQDVAKPLTEPGTFGVTYLNGYPVDDIGRLAVTLLALEFGAAAAGATCRLPANATSVVRNGMAMTLVARSFVNGVTNIPEVDAYTSLWNPKARTGPSRVWSPDLPDFRTTSSTSVD